MKCNVDVVRIRENSIQLNGWAIGKTPETEITYQVEDGAHQPIRFQYVATRRDDVSQIYFGRTVEKELGFDIQFPYERGVTYKEDKKMVTDAIQGMKDGGLYPKKLWEE